MTYFSGLIFDFNGVLWWDNALQEQAWRDFSARLRGVPLSPEEMAEHVHGRNNPYTLQYLAGTALTGERMDQLSEQKEEIYRNLCLEQGDKFRLSPGAEPLLDFLVREEVPHTIATASGKGNVDFFVDHLNLARWFDLDKIVYDDGAMDGKPAPDFFLAAADRLDVPPGRCIVIEDSISGLKAARAAGIGRVFLLDGDGGHAGRLEPQSSATVINDLTELDRSLFRP